MEPSGPRSDCPVLWTMTGSHSSNGLPCFSLKRRCFILFFSPPNMASFGAFWLNNPETKPSGPSLSASSSPSQSLSRLCLSPLSPSQLSQDRNSLSASLSRSSQLSHRNSLSASSSSPSFGTIINFCQFIYFFMLCSGGTRFGCVWLYLVSVRSKL